MYNTAASAASVTLSISNILIMPHFISTESCNHEFCKVSLYKFVLSPFTTLDNIVSIVNKLPNITAKTINSDPNIQFASITDYEFINAMLESQKFIAVDCKFNITVYGILPNQYISGLKPFLLCPLIGWKYINSDTISYEEHIKITTIIDKLSEFKTFEEVVNYARVLF